MTEKVMIQINNEVVEAKGETLEYIESWKTDLDQAAAKQATQEAAKKASKASAIVKLTALGLTEQEVFDLLDITPDTEKE
jgi:DNA-directed RNA polymerase subunit F